MISTKNIQVIPLSKENILLFLTHEQIFRKYIPYNFKVDEIFSACYREDRKPSFGIYFNNHYKILMFKDLSKKIGGDSFEYVRLIHNNCSLWEACKIINRDFKLNLGGYSTISIVNTTQPIFVPKIKEKRLITILSQDFTDIDIKYWGSYGISVETLKKFNVYSVKKLFINNVLKRVYTDKYPMYCYYFPRTGNKKIYIPHENKWNKWDNNASNEWDIQGYDQLPKTGDTIYITKSMKDVMVLYELGLNAVATHGEAHYFNPDFFRHLRGRFKKIILFYDNDEAGKECTEKVMNNYKLDGCMFIPDENKDISDYVKNRGKEEGKRLFS